MGIEKATGNDIPEIAALFDAVHTAEESGLAVIGWVRDVYPTRETAEQALLRGDLFVMKSNGSVVGTAIINQRQVDVYASARWSYNVPENEIMVLHTLVISPAQSGHGFGSEFVEYYENYARSNNCHYLRMDTNERNTAARTLYHKLGYRETDIVSCTFNGIVGVRLVLLEKRL